MTSQSATAVCRTCECVGSLDEFYGTSGECRRCKRLRSQENRVIAGQKIALAERLINALERLADQGWNPAAAFSAISRGPAGDSTALPDPSTDSPRSQP